jgi:hypothetical protein
VALAKARQAKAELDKIRIAKTEQARADILAQIQQIKLEKRARAKQAKAEAC